MIASFMLYGTALAALLAVAAFSVERAFGAFGLPRRGAWLVAIVASVGVPLFSILNPNPQPPTYAPITLASDAGFNPRVVPSSRQPSEPVPRTTRPMSTMQWPSLPKIDVLLTALWVAGSATLALFYLVGGWRVRRTAAAWRPVEIEGRTIFVSDEVGPAVFGFVHPRVVLPNWVLQSPRSVRDLVLEHELQHVAARDPWALLVALTAVVIAPWNPALWWQLRRLRLAIEIDCDARVLARGADPISYGEVLLSVGRLHLAAPAPSVALTEPRSDIEHRIRSFVSAPSRHRASIAIGCSALCASMIAAAAQIDAPLAQERLRLLPPPQNTMTTQIEAAVKREFPELFSSPLSAPVLVKVLLNNDLTIDVAEKHALLPGTTLETAIGESDRNGGFAADRLHPADPRAVGRIVAKGEPDSAPVYVSFTARVVAKSRSAAIVEPALRERFPELYDDSTDSQMLLMALMNEDGTVAKALHRRRDGSRSLMGEENQRKTLAELGVAPQEVGTVAMLSGREKAPFKPLVLYAFPRNKDARVDATPFAPNSQQLFDIQRELVRRHFPDTVSGVENEHKLLWVLLDSAGDVVQYGRQADSPESLVWNLEQVHPGIRDAKRVTTQLGALFGKDMRDSVGEPLLVTFVWLPEVVSRPGDALDLMVQAKYFRNDVPVATQMASYKFRETKSVDLQDEMRVDITAVRVSADEVEIRMQMRARIERKGAAFADPWQIVATPTARVRYGAEAVIEQGVRYPDANKRPDIWRIAVTPRRT